MTARGNVRVSQYPIASASTPATVNASSAPARARANAPAIPPVMGAKVWYDATTLSLSEGASVNSWSDLSGDGFNLSTTSTNKPNFYSTTSAKLINGHPTVFFNGSTAANYMDAQGWTSMSQPDVMYLVCYSQASDGSHGRAIDISTGSNRQLLDVQAGAPGAYEYIVETGGVAEYTSAGTTSSIPKLVTIQFNGSSTTLRQNGAYITINGASNLTTSGMDSLRLGSDAAGGSALQGAIGELLIFPALHTASQVAAVENYLAQKWGISLAASVTASSATARASAPAPSVVSGSTVAAKSGSVRARAAGATAVVGNGAAVAASSASMRARAVAPTVSAGQTVNPPAASVEARAAGGTATGGASVTVPDKPAPVAARAAAPSVTAGVTAPAVASSARAKAPAPAAVPTNISAKSASARMAAPPASAEVFVAAPSTSAKAVLRTAAPAVVGVVAVTAKPAHAVAFAGVAFAHGPIPASPGVVSAGVVARSGAADVEATGVSIDSVAVNDTAVSGSLTVTTTKANELVVIVIGTFSGNADYCALDGNALTAQVHETANGSTTFLYDTMVATPGTHTVTYNLSTSYGIDVVIACSILGVTNSGAVYAANTNVSSMATTAFNTGATLVYQQINHADPPIPTSSGGEQMKQIADGSTGNENGYRLEWYIPTATGTETISGLSGSYQSVLLASYPNNIIPATVKATPASARSRSGGESITLPCTVNVTSARSVVRAKAPTVQTSGTFITPQVKGAVARGAQPAPWYGWTVKANPSVALVRAGADVTAVGGKLHTVGWIPIV